MSNCQNKTKTYVWRKGTAGILRDDPGPPKGSEGTNRQLSMSSIGIRGLLGGFDRPCL